MTTTIPARLTGPTTGSNYNAAWLDPTGSFHATPSHRDLVTATAVGYEHYNHGWLRITFTPARREVGAGGQHGHDITEAQIGALLYLLEHTEADNLFGNRGGILAHEATPEIIAEMVRG